MTKRSPISPLVSVAVLGLSIVPVGTAVFVLGFGAGDSPCVMCWEQRIGMIIIALIGLFVLRYGPQPKYAGLAVLVASWGIFMGLRHASMHAARDIGQGFSIEVLGAHTYTWALLIYWVCAITIGVLLILTRGSDLVPQNRPSTPLQRTAMLVFLVVVAANALQAFASTGPPPFVGQSDPVRFSFNPAHWVWSLEEWSPSPISLRGRWAIGKPDISRTDADPASGPLSGLTPLSILEEKRLAVALRGTPTGLAYDSASDQFAVTTERAVHVVDASFAKIVRDTVLDTGFSVDLARLADIAFLGPRTLMALSENKSYVILRENDAADPRRNFRFFVESFDRFDELSRSRLSTVRARMMYTLSLAFDPSTQSLYTLTVPNDKVHRLVVSRFDRSDLTLSEEFSPALASGSRVAVRGNARSLDELYVTAAVARNGLLYALSAAYSTLLVIDVKTHAVVGAHTIRGIARPTGMALRGDRLYVLGQDSRIVVVPAPGATPAGPQSVSTPPTARAVAK